MCGMNNRKITENTFGGEFPIYYNEKGEWSQNPTDLLAQGKPALNPTLLYDFFLFRTEVSPESVYAGLKSLFPGEELWEIDGKLVTKNPKYERLAAVRERRDGSVKEYVDEADRLLGRSINEGLRGAKNVALTLSGGVDSSLLATYLPKDTRCITWGGWGERGTDVTYSEKVAEALGLKSHSVVAFDFLKDEQLYRDAVKNSPTPFMYTLGVSFLRMSEQLKKEFGGEKYSLVVGQNADTIAGAYKTTIAVYYFSRLALLTQFIPFPQKFLNEHRKFSMLSSPNPFVGFAFHHSTGLFPSSYLELPHDYFATKLADFDRQIRRSYSRFHDSVIMEELMVEARRAQFAQHVLPRMYGGHTIAPFYDEQLVSHMFSVPKHIRRMHNSGKVIIRELALKRGVPAEVVKVKEKKGLSYNYKQFFAEGKHLPIWDELEKDPMLNKYLDVKGVRGQHEKNYFTMDLLRSLHVFFQEHEFEG